MVMALRFVVLFCAITIPVSLALKRGRMLCVSTRFYCFRDRWGQSDSVISQISGHVIPSLAWSKRTITSTTNRCVGMLTAYTFPCPDERRRWAFEAAATPAATDGMGAILTNEHLFLALVPTL